MSQTLLASKKDTFRRIVQAAKDEFAEHGLAGSRMDVIARRAGINKAALYYHIGDKHALYTKVLNEVLSSTHQTIADIPKGAQDPEEKIRMYIRSVGATVNSNPQMCIN